MDVWAVAVTADGRWLKASAANTTESTILKVSEFATVQKHSLKPPGAQPIIMIITVQLQFVKYTTPHWALNGLWKCRVFTLSKFQVFQSSHWNHFKLLEVFFQNENLDAFEDVTCSGGFSQL